MRPAVLGDISRPGLGRPAIAAAAVCIVLMGSGGLAAQEKTPATRPAEKPKTVSNVFVDTDLREALQDVASQLEVVIVPDSSVTGLVTCELKDATLDQALEIVLAGTGYVVKKMPGYHLVCSGDPTSPSFRLVSETRVVKLNYAKATEAAKQLTKPFQGYVLPNDATNTLSITAPPEMLERIVADVKLIDKRPGHVILQARIVGLERTKMQDLGIQWGWPQIRAGAFGDSDTHGGGVDGLGWSWGLEAGYTPGKEFTNALVLTLNLLAQNGEATIVASPRLVAQDGKEAEIKVTTEEYFQITSEGVYSQARLEKIETGTTLKISPRIGDNGEITLTVMTEVSGVVARGDNNLPVVTRRIAQNVVRIDDGGTIVVAGLMDTRTSDTKTWVPGLGNLPLLGELFTDRSGSEVTRQIAVFITASRVEREPGTDRKVPRTAPRRIELVKEKTFKYALMASMRRLDRAKRRP